MSGFRCIGAITSALAAIAGCVGMEPSVVDPEAYLGTSTTSPSVYQSHATPLLLPLLDVRIDPMDRLFLVNIADDPIYEGVELQTFPRPDSEPEVRVLLWRADTVDVYDSPGRAFDEALDRRALEALLSPRAVTLQRATIDYRFRVTGHGLDAALRIRDREGRDLDLELVETRGEPRFGALIAPVGSGSARPDYLPLFFLDEFALVRRRGAQIRITVDGQQRSPSKMTRLVKGPASYFTRYSSRVVIAHWNERREALLEPVRLSPGAGSVQAADMEWRIAWNGGHPEVRAAVARAGENAVTFLFSPALPDLTALRPGSRVEGRFVINVNDVPGVVAGEYAVNRAGNRVTLVFQPLDAWQPPIVRGPPWVASYRYQATIAFDGEQPRLWSEWIRHGGD